MYLPDPPLVNGAGSTITAEPALLTAGDLEPPLVVVAGPRMPRRTKWLDLPDEYGEAGMKLHCWVNYPARLGQDIDSGERERVFPALYQVVLGHNGWVGDDGAVLPAVNTQQFWDDISTELALTVLRLISLEGSRLPSSLKRPSGN